MAAQWHASCLRSAAAQVCPSLPITTPCRIASYLRHRLTPNSRPTAGLLTYRRLFQDSECDQKIVCCLNIVIIISCLCQVCSDGDSEEEQCFHTLVDCFYNAVVSCYNSQHQAEIEYQKTMIAANPQYQSP